MPDARDDLIAVIKDARYWKRRFEDGYVSTGENSTEHIADAILQAFDLTPRDTLPPYEYAIELGTVYTRRTTADDDLEGTLERLDKYHEWAPEARIVRRRSYGAWEPVPEENPHA